MAKYFFLLVACTFYTTTAAKESLRGTLIKSGNTRHEALPPMPRIFLGKVDEVSVRFSVSPIFTNTNCMNRTSL